MAFLRILNNFMNAYAFFFNCFEVHYRFNILCLCIFCGALVAQSVECLALDFCLSLDLMVHEIEPHVGLCVDGAEPAWDSVSASLSLLLPYSLALSPSQNKSLKLFKKSNKKKF